jgi:putative transposase
MDYYPPLLPDKLYHITGRAVGNEKLFLRNENYHFFLKKFDRYISPVADTVAWALLPNHFHFLIRIKPYQSLLEHYKKIKPHGKEDEDWQPGFVMKRFSNLLNSYAKSFNKVNKRRGALFIDYMRRREVKTAAHYNATIFYIHKNPVHHGCCKKITDWPWSSYKSIVSGAPTKMEHEMLLDWFGGTGIPCTAHSFKKCGDGGI